MDAGVTARRREAWRVLAKAPAAAIAESVATLESVPSHQVLRGGESGLVMLRGRIGGDGAPFNLGEATVSRAAVKLTDGPVGYGYVLGRDREKARLIALCDALLQWEPTAGFVEDQVLAPLRQAIETQRSIVAEQTAATRVEFFTMVRGE
jgi:alpha-D-ribose 1-methylphosphonate 5-triphosphate synthase subunit PhnG